jgi:hypothetical protein
MSPQARFGAAFRPSHDANGYAKSWRCGTSPEALAEPGNNRFGGCPCPPNARIFCKSFANLSLGGKPKIGNLPP